MCIFALANVPGSVPLIGARGQRLAVIAYELVLTTYGESAAGAHMVLSGGYIADVSGVLPVHSHLLGLRFGGVEGARSRIYQINSSLHPNPGGGRAKPTERQTRLGNQETSP